MATHLHQLLRTLCWNTEWNYAVFWKLKHRAPMVLSWEDGYYNNQLKLDLSESEGLDSLQDGQFAPDSLGQAVAKMSHVVYSVGEGIVGQVAVTGKYQWLFAGEHGLHSHSLAEFSDGWQAQFAAGIKTIVVAAVVPHGVIQLGSLNKVTENLQLLINIRDAFTHLQESACCIQTPVQFSLQDILQMSDTSSRIVGPEALQNYLLDKAANKDHIWSSSSDILTLQKHLNDLNRGSIPDLHLNGADGLIGKNGLPEAISSVNIAEPVPINKQSTDLLNEHNCGRNISTIQNAGTNDSREISYSSQSCLTETSTLYAGNHSAEEPRVQFKPPADYCESAARSASLFDVGDNPSGRNVSKLVAFDSLEKQTVENDMDNQPEFSCLETLSDLKSSFMFSAGTELHEVLGPAFLQQCCPIPEEVEKAVDSSTSQMPRAIESSLLTSDSGTDHLLEAVVANFCRTDAALKCAKSFSMSESTLTTERMPEPTITTGHAISSSCYSVGGSSLLEGSTQNCFNSSDSCGIRSSASACGDPLARSTEPGKPNKKRARPGENSRPRPRDRQLIQDRIKELRELVPNGSKCSIDSLLERTIKHMGFMQSVSKHSNKLSYCSKSKACSNDIGVLESGYERGSSWAVEVGGHMKICPILVENLNMNGQMLIEMLCEDCDHFLEIAEAIRSLGLTILKGITDSHGDKTWMRFVVEGQSNRNLHRMDVLWSLVQLLQSKPTPVLS